MVRVNKTRQPDIIMVEFNDEQLQYEMSTVNDWLTYEYERGEPEFIIEGIVFIPQSLMVDMRSLREALAQSEDSYILHDLDIKFYSSCAPKEYKESKIQKVINFCEQQDIWVGWDRHRICININHSFNKQDADDISHFSDRKLAELLLWLESNHVNYTEKDSAITIIDENTTMTIDTINCRVDCLFELYGRKYRMNVDTGFRGFSGDRMWILTEAIKKQGIEILQAFILSQPVKVIELLIDMKFSLIDASGSTLEFSFRENGKIDINRILTYVNNN